MKGDWPDPHDLSTALDRLLPRVEKPTRYVGGEVNARIKHEADVRVALAFPDVYEIGMSHLGFRILYGLLNGQDGIAAERVFMPWIDMLALLREQRLPLTTLETRRPLSSFDMVGFSLQYELTLTNVLAMLDLCRIPLLADDRREGHPLILAGGPAAFNPEVCAPFFDLMLFGDAEEALPEMLALYRRLKRDGAPRAEIVRTIAATQEGWYAPAFYDLATEPVMGFLCPRPKPGSGVPARVKRRVVYDLEKYPFPADIVVPHGEIVHDRISWEVMRGCPVGCRFCQAGYVYRPTRERDPASVQQGVRASVAATGYDEFSLTSLNTGEYGAIEPLLTALMDEMAPQHVAVGLSSLHATTLTPTLVEQIKRVRKTGFTMAPEAGSERMREVINKNLTEDDVLRAARLAFEAGWDLIKLYFMIGLPTETMDDVDALVDLAGRIAKMGREINGPRAKVTLSASTFIPKVFTPFQWFGMDPEDLFAAKQRRIRERVPRGVQFKHHDRSSSWLEGVLSRTDRRVVPALVTAYRNGAVMDGWTECFRVDVWRAAFEAHGIDADTLATQPIPLEAELPWEVVDPLVRRKWLEREYKLSLEAGTKVPCASDACSGCAPFAKECIKGIVAEQKWSRESVLPACDASSSPVPRLGPAPFAPAALPALAACAMPSAGVAGALAVAGPPAEGSVPAEVCAPADVSAPAEAPAPADVEKPMPRPIYRFRAQFEKLGRSRYLGHLDLVRALTMAFRRAGLPLAYSEGFKPHPKLSLSPALSLGIASLAEYVDVDVHAPLAAEDVLPAVNATLPEGLRLTALVPLDVRATSLQDAIRLAEYRAVVPGVTPDTLRAAVDRFAASEAVEITRVRKGKSKALDLKPLVAGLAVDGDGALRFGLTLTREGSARPSEVIGAIASAEAADAAETIRLAMYTGTAERPLSPLLDGHAQRVREP